MEGSHNCTEVKIFRLFRERRADQRLKKFLFIFNFPIAITPARWYNKDKLKGKEPKGDKNDVSNDGSKVRRKKLYS